MDYTGAILRLENQDYQLRPVENTSRHPPRLRKAGDPIFKYTDDYEYKKLDGASKKIRLLQLNGGAIDAQDIYCELIEADYDNRFHMPTALNAPKKYKGPQNSEGMTEEEMEADNLEAFKGLQPYEIKYEALSWCWGSGDPEYVILINAKDQNGRNKLYKFKVREQLALALKYLRSPDKSKTLWIDAICINQEDPSERNHQVQMMSRIYTRAKEVCIWLGDSDSDSIVAIPFITKDIIKLHKFDHLCSDKQYTEKWKSLMMLMQREWFSRRWVVQEIALASKATIHCGQDSMKWSEFAVAVELVVEVESATHRLSEIMQTDVKFQHVPGWFEYVSHLGASLLVQATGKVFRARRSPLDEEETAEDKVLQERIRVFQNIDPLDRKSLLSLEYLVSTFFIFGASEPRDAVYAMLALSRDSAPFPDLGANSHDDKTRLMMMTCEPFLEEKPFIVDYRRPYSEVCKDFVSFAIERRRRSDPSQALDILCRPWALQPPDAGKESVRLKGHPKTAEPKRLVPPRDAKKKPWKIRRRDPENEKVYLDEYEPDNVTNDKYWERVSIKFPKPDKNWEWWGYFPDRQSPSDRKENKSADMPLPSWIAKASQAPISLHFSPGIEPRITGRSNADPLVGSPQDGHRNYSAAQTQPPKLLEFRRRPLLNHYSLFVNGFIVDEVDEVLDASQGGNIPKSWLDLAGWEDTDNDPPIEFWRTLVADRGRDNRNPPYYYATACRESAIKGGIASGRIDTAALINNERNSIVAEFCRRVHAVIWNRRLFKTKKGRLGLGATNVKTGDKVCILYGCTVPVILHQKSKEKGQLDEEEKEDLAMSLRHVVQKMEMLRQRKADNIKKEEQIKKALEMKLAKHKEEQIKKALEMKLAEHKKEAQSKEAQSKEAQSKEAQSKGSKITEEMVEMKVRQLLKKMESEKEKGEEIFPSQILEWQRKKDREDLDKAAELYKKLETKGGHKSKGGAYTRRRRDKIPRSETNSRGEGEKLGSGEQAKEVLAEQPEEQQQAGSSGDGHGTKSTDFRKRQDDAEEEDLNLYYKFLGDCYLHGMMDGEAIREKFHQQIVERTFELR